jgi:hypothetical protein
MPGPSRPGGLPWESAGEGEVGRPALGWGARRQAAARSSGRQQRRSPRPRTSTPRSSASSRATSGSTPSWRRALTSGAWPPRGWRRTARWLAMPGPTARSAAAHIPAPVGRPPAGGPGGADPMETLTRV